MGRSRLHQLGRQASLQPEVPAPRPPLGRSLSFGQAPPPCRRPPGLEQGRRSSSLAERRGKLAREERESVVQLLSLRLGGGVVAR